MTAAGLLQAWVEVLDGLRTDALPQGEPFPLDLSPVQAAAVAQMSDARGWEVLFESLVSPLGPVSERSRVVLLGWPRSGVLEQGHALGCPASPGSG